MQTTVAPMTAHNASQSLQERIESKSATIGVVGLGYVGLPVAAAAHDAGFPVLGYDRDRHKIDMISRGESYLKHLGDDLVRELSKSKRFGATSDGARLKDADVILLCVPTPLGEHSEPDLSFVLDSARMVAKSLRKGQLIVLESTTYPGTTRDEVLPLLESTGLECGRDFFLAYSPEREDPGRTGATTRGIPRLVAGVDQTSGDLAYAFYSRVIDNVHRVSSAEVAESAKLLENIYRAVNIALVNELKVVLGEMGIDVWEVIAAASTKPFGFQAFYPGPGLGGHCIPIDPFYLTWTAKEVGCATKFIELAGEINRAMPKYVVSRVAAALNDDGKSLRGASVLIIGIAYKPNIDDVRESPAAEIIDLLHEAGATISYHDPHVPRFPKMRKHDIRMDSIALTEKALRSVDCVLIVTDHAKVDYDALGRSAKLIVDTRNAMAKVRSPAARVVKA